MNRSEAVEAFYTSHRWRKCRKAFLKSKGNLCENCLKKGIINPGSKESPLEVHHKIQLTDDNINEPNITLNWENLEALCKVCHDEKKQKAEKRWKIREDGKAIV